MSANVVQLERLFRRSWDWSPRELAEFYRVESALIQAGLKIDTERGLSDEGDPWFAFCRPDDGEVIVHIARIGGVYILAGPSYDGIASGGDIAALVRDLVTRHPLIQMRGDNHRQGSKIFLHPAALLIAVVATAFFKSTEARALSDDHKSGGDTRGGGLAPRSENVSVLESHKTIVMDAAHSAVILSAVAAVLQAPPPFATEHDVTTVTTPVATASDLLDFAVLSPPALHALSSLSGPPSWEAHQFEAHQDAYAQLNNGAVVFVNTPAHAGIADALPLIVVLWDLPANSSVTKTIAHDNAGDASAVTTGLSLAPAALQSPVLIFKMALPKDANENLPVVQVAKVSYSDIHGVTETQTISQPDHLPTALVNALSQATHTTVDTQSVSLPNSTSFANALILSLDHSAEAPHANALNPPLTDQSAEQAPHANALVPPLTDQSAEQASHAPLNTSGPQSQGSSTTEPAAGPVSQSQTATTDTPSSAQAPSEIAIGVAAQVQDFFNYTPSWATLGSGKEFVVYDTAALTSRPSELKSVTFDFSDGSTLSLVGLHAALPHSLVA